MQDLLGSTSGDLAAQVSGATGTEESKSGGIPETKVNKDGFLEIFEPLEDDAEVTAKKE